MKLGQPLYSVLCGRVVLSKTHRRVLVAMGLGAALALLLLTGSRARAQSPAPHDIVFLIDNSQSVRTGEGAPDGQPTDPAQMRLRLAHFIINVLGVAPTGANQRVGVISFADSTQTLMPLTPVLDWSKADFAEIRAVRQAGGTDFARALDAVSDVLPADCSPDIRRCDVVMVTDGIFEKYTVRRDQRAVQNTLQNLRSRGISVHLLTFGAQDPVWQEFLTNDLVSSYQPGVTSTPPSQVYDTVLRNLGFETLLTDLMPVEVVGEKVVPLTIHDFHTWTRYRILSDTPLTVTFSYADQAVAPVVVGTEYTLFEPQAGEWRVRLQGNGLAYYRQTGVGVTDLSLYLRAPEGALPLGEDVTVYAGLTAGGTPVTDLTPFEATATINGPVNTNDPLELELDRTVNLFAATVPADWFESGVYTVTVAAQSSVPDLVVQPATGQFEMIALPTLAMTVTPTGTIRSGQSVQVIVTVENWRPGYVPRLQIYGSEAVGLVTSTWSTQGTGTFTSTITTPSGVGSSFAVAVQLARDEGTTEVELFDSIQTAPQLVEYAVPPIVTTTQYPTWLLIPLCVVFVIGVYAWWRFNSANKHRRRERRIKRLRDDVEALARVVGEMSEEPGPIIESWNV